MSADPPVRVLVEHLFRHEAGRMLARLSHALGLEHLELAEEVVQDALLEALRQWAYHGVPDNPSAWLMRVARNRALDRLRRQTALRRKEADLLERFHERQDALEAPGVRDVDVLDDEQLAMIFACCDPVLTPDSRVALTLKAVSAFSVAEIARAFLADEAAIAQRLVRAKRRLREAAVTLAIPAAAELPARLDSVLRVVYLLFNEGYGAHAGANLVRADLCGEALRLARLIAAHPATALPKVHALLALFLFQSARLSTRVDGEGNLLLLADQPRADWDTDRLSQGIYHLERAADGAELSEYHLQAGIAAVHATSAHFDDTDWPYLLRLYDDLFALTPSPVVALNRAIARSMVDGPATALEMLEPLGDDAAMKGYFLLPAVRADLLRRLGRPAEAAECYRQALECPCTEPEQRFLNARLRDVVRSELAGAAGAPGAAGE